MTTILEDFDQNPLIFWLKVFAQHALRFSPKSFIIFLKSLIILTLTIEDTNKKSFKILINIVYDFDQKKLTKIIYDIDKNHLGFWPKDFYKIIHEFDQECVYNFDKNPFKFWPKSFYDFNKNPFKFWRKSFKVLPKIINDFF